MGEAKRRDITCIGRIGEHADNDALHAALQRVLAELQPVIDDCAEREGWPAVLNALVTAYLNLSLDLRGAGETERVCREILRQVPAAAAAKRLHRDGPTAGRA